MRTLIKDLYSEYSKFSDKDVIISGWIRSNRDSKSFGFIELNDGTFMRSVQVVYDDKLSNYGDIAKLNIGSALTVKGKVILTPDMKQPFELKAAEIIIEGLSTPEYPLQKKRHSMEFLREIAYLRPRTNTFSALFRVRSALAFAIHKFFNERHFTYVHTPIITASDCEGAGEMFRVTTLDIEKPPKKDGKVDYSQDFFGKSANLTVSGQLSGECFAMAFSNIYTFGPTFRAEKSYTARHAAEFWMIEPEIAFATLKEDMELARDLMKYVIKYVLDNCAEDIKFFNDFVDEEHKLTERLKFIVESEFAHVTYTEAVDILLNSKEKFEYPVKWGVDLQTEHERYLTEVFFKKPVFVTDYPKEIKAFYMRLNDDGKTVAAMDLLVPGVGEIIGGSQREERLDYLEAAIKRFGLKPEDYWWYCDLRRYGGNKHAGFGLGFERLVMYVTGITNIRDSIPFPRTTSSAEF